MPRARFRIGAYVIEVDGRHVGRVVAVFAQRVYRVRWIDTGWRSDLAADQITHAPGYPIA